MQEADRVLVMEEGRICAFDTPERLLETCDIYREVYESQNQGGSGDFDEDAKRDGSQTKGGARV